MSLRLPASSGIRLIGSATAFPSEIGIGMALSNADAYRELLGEDATSILAERGLRSEHPAESWGVLRREWMRKVDLPVAGATSDVVLLAAESARRAMADAQVGAEEVSILLAATSSPPRITSTLAAYVGRELGVSTACLDLRAGGAGALSAWLTAARFLGPECPIAVVVAIETPSLYIDPGDLAAALLYGDGAAAIVLRHEPSHGGGLLGGVLARADAPGRAFTVPGSLPPSPTELAAGRYVYQQPDADYRGALAAAWTALCEELRSSFPDAAAATAHFAPYAVTAGQVQQASLTLGVSDERVRHTLADHGCIGCPSPLVALDRVRHAGNLNEGEVVAMAAVAGGVSMAGMYWRV